MIPILFKLHNQSVSMALRLGASHYFAECVGVKVPVNPRRGRCKQRSGGAICRSPGAYRYVTLEPLELWKESNRADGPF